MQLPSQHSDSRCEMKVTDIVHQDLRFLQWSYLFHPQGTLQLTLSNDGFQGPGALQTRQQSRQIWPSSSAMPPSAAAMPTAHCKDPCDLMLVCR